MERVVANSEGLLAEFVKLGPWVHEDSFSDYAIGVGGVLGGGFAKPVQVFKQVVREAQRVDLDENLDLVRAFVRVSNEVKELAFKGKELLSFLFRVENDLSNISVESRAQFMADIGRLTLGAKRKTEFEKRYDVLQYVYDLQQRAVSEEFDSIAVLSRSNGFFAKKESETAHSKAKDSQSLISIFKDVDSLDGAREEDSSTVRGTASKTLRTMERQKELGFEDGWLHNTLSAVDDRLLHALDKWPVLFAHSLYLAVIKSKSQEEFLKREEMIDYADSLRQRVFNMGSQELKGLRRSNGFSSGPTAHS